MLKINSFDLYEVLAYLFLWITLYFLLCLWNSARSFEWHCRTVTSIHAMTISALGFYSTFLIGPWPFTDAGGPNSPMQIRIVSLCLAYFLFDFSWCLYFKTEGPVMLIHHALSIMGLTWCLCSGKYGCELVATVFGAEITNPLLQLRWFLRETGNYKTIWGDIVDWAFMLSFGFCRIILGSILLYCYYQQNTDFWGRLGGTCLYSISWIFFISIVNYAIRKYVRRYRQWVMKHPHSSANGMHISKTPNGEVQGGGDADIKTEGVGVIKDKEIPTPREIKDGDRELTLRKNCVVQESLET